MKLTEYWAWYRQRVSRVWHDRKLPEPHMIRHLDAQSLYYCDPERWLKPTWCECMVDPSLFAHLPYTITVKNQPGSNRFEPSAQERWCDRHVGLRDRDWLYLGHHLWAFRLQSDATCFQLVWS